MSIWNARLFFWISINDGTLDAHQVQILFIWLAFEIDIALLMRLEERNEFLFSKTGWKQTTLMNITSCECLKVSNYNLHAYTTCFYECLRYPSQNWVLGASQILLRHSQFEVVLSDFLETATHHFASTVQFKQIVDELRTQNLHSHCEVQKSTVELEASNNCRVIEESLMTSKLSALELVHQWT